MGNPRLGEGRDPVGFLLAGRDRSQMGQPQGNTHAVMLQTEQILRPIQSESNHNEEGPMAGLFRRSVAAIMALLDVEEERKIDHIQTSGAKKAYQPAKSGDLEI